MVYNLVLMNLYLIIQQVFVLKNIKQNTKNQLRIYNEYIIMQ